MYSLVVYFVCHDVVELGQRAVLSPYLMVVAHYVRGLLDVAGESEQAGIEGLERREERQRLLAFVHIGPEEPRVVAVGQEALNGALIGAELSDELGLVEQHAALEQVLEVGVDAAANRGVHARPLAALDVQMVADQIERRAQLPQRVERSLRHILVRRIARQARQCGELEQERTHASYAFHSHTHTHTNEFKL